MTVPESAPPRRPCIHCGETLHGRYCHACGQDNLRRDRTLTELFFDALSELFSLDGRVFATLRDVVVRPGRYLVAYREGRTLSSVSPIKLFLVVSAAFFVALTWGNLAIYQFSVMRTGDAPVSARLVPHGVEIVGGEIRDRYLMPSVDLAAYDELMSALNGLKASADPDQSRAIADLSSYASEWIGLNDVLAERLPPLLWLLMPIYALMLWPLFGPHRPLADHMVFALWAQCMIFGILLIFAGLNHIGLQVNFWVLGLPYLGMFTLAARPYYGGRIWTVALRGFLHITLFFCFIWVPAVLILSFSQIEFPASLWLSDTGDSEVFTRWILPPELHTPKS